MPIHITSKYLIDIRQDRGLGSNWVVKVYRKRPFLKKCISTDWFLDEAQAQRFVDDLRSSLDRPDIPELLADRTPGWTLRRPAR